MRASIAHEKGLKIATCIFAVRLTAARWFLTDLSKQPASPKQPSIGTQVAGRRTPSHRMPPEEHQRPKKDRQYKLPYFEDYWNLLKVHNCWNHPNCSTISTYLNCCWKRPSDPVSSTESCYSAALLFNTPQADSGNTYEELNSFKNPCKTTTGIWKYLDNDIFWWYMCYVTYLYFANLEGQGKWKMTALLNNDQWWR
jgi:hypothetical protein